MFTLDRVDRRILRLAVPAIATLAIAPLYALVDTAVVGHLGTAPLAGVALATTAISTSFFVVTVLEYGITARVAFAIGRGHERAAAGITIQGLWLAGVVSLAIAVALALFANPIARALGGEGEALEAATTYLRISAVAVPSLLAALVSVGYLRGVQDTRTPLIIVAFGNALNVVLELWFVYGLDYGVAGSAWSTVIAQTISAAWFLTVVLSRARSLSARVRPDRDRLVELLRSGGHLSIRTGALLGTLALSTAVAARLGDAVVGGHQIGLQLFLFLALFVDGLAIAAQALIGSALGAGDIETARDVGRRLLRLGLWLGGAIAVVIIALSGVLPHVFTDEADVRRQATIALVALGLLQPIGALTFVLDGVLLGASDDLFQGGSNALAFAVFIPVALAVLHWRDLGLAGIWAGLAAWMLTRLVTNYIRFRGRRWTRT